MEAKRNLAALVDPISKQPFNLTNNLPYALTCGHTLSLTNTVLKVLSCDTFIQE